MKTEIMKYALAACIAALTACTGATGDNTKDDMNTTHPALTQHWDKTFPQSDEVDHRKVTFRNRYGITLAADLYMPRNTAGRLPAIAVSGPFGAVKEQASGLYAQTMARRGFVTLAFDPSFTGESRATWPLPTSVPRISAQR